MIKDKYPEFYLTQTSTKDLESDQTCPTRWKGLWLDKTVSFPSNEDMDKGKYFEWLCLGGGAISGEDVTDLPRVYGGKKSVDQQRIEQQAERFKRMFNPDDPEYIGHTIISSQLEIKDEVSKRKGTIDFVTLEDATGIEWVNDLKLTKDATSTRSKWGWGHPWEDLDMLQMVHYRDLYIKGPATFDKAKTALWVFDYSPSLRVKIGEIQISDKAKNAKEIRMNSAWDVIELYEENGWTTYPSEAECKGCPLACESRFKLPPIEKLIINI